MPNPIPQDRRPVHIEGEEVPLYVDGTLIVGIYTRENGCVVGPGGTKFHPQQVPGGWTYRPEKGRPKEK